MYAINGMILTPCISGFLFGVVLHYSMTKSVGPDRLSPYLGDISDEGDHLQNAGVEARPAPICLAPSAPRARDTGVALVLPEADTAAMNLMLAKLAKLAKAMPSRAERMPLSCWTGRDGTSVGTSPSPRT